MLPSNNSATLLVIIIFFIFLSLGLLSLVIRQRRQIKDLEEVTTPKYGFLGKPLLSMMALAVLAGGLGLTYFASQNVQDVTVRADKDLQIAINAEVQVRVNNDFSVKFFVIPSVEEQAWAGTFTDTFDVFWTVTGPTTFSQIELGLTQSNQGGFVRTVPAGSYTVEVSVIYGSKTWKESKIINIP
jgi:hypothetical protein